MTPKLLEPIMLPEIKLAGRFSTLQRKTTAKSLERRHKFLRRIKTLHKSAL